MLSHLALSKGLRVEEAAKGQGPETALKADCGRRWGFEGAMLGVAAGDTPAFAVWAEVVITRPMPGT